MPSPLDHRDRNGAGEAQLRVALGASAEERAIKREPRRTLRVMGLVIAFVCVLPTLLLALGFHLSPQEAMQSSFEERLGQARDALTGVDAETMLRSVMNVEPDHAAKPSAELGETARQHLEALRRYALHVSIAHILLELIGFVVIVFILAFAIVAAFFRNAASLAVIGTPLFLVGSLDALQIMVEEGVISAAAPIEAFLPFSWFLLRDFHALALLLGWLTLWHLHRRGQSQHKGLISILNSVCTLGAVAIALVCVNIEAPPRLIYVGDERVLGVLTRPYELIPAALFLLLSAVLAPMLYQRGRNTGVLFLGLSVLPLVAAQLHMAFGAADNVGDHFFAAHLLKLFAYVIPFAGLSLEYVWAFRERASAEAALHRRESQLTDFLENAGDLIQMLDAEGRLLYVNRAWRQALDYSLDEVVGRSVFDYYHEDVRSLARGNFTLMLAGETIDHLELVFRTKEGAPLFVEGSASFQFEDGQPIASRCLFRDVTARRLAERELRESETRYRLVAESASDLIWTIDPDLNFTYVSPVVEQLLGYSVEESVGSPVTTTLTPEAADVVRSELDKMQAKRGRLDGEPFALRTLQVEQLRKDGTRFWTEVSASLLYDDEGEFLGLIGITRDIDERKRAEQLLRSAKEETDRANARLEQAIERTRQLALQAEGASLAKSQFLANVSHEIRTPMTAIMGFADLLMDEELAAEQRSSVQRIRQSAEALLALVEDVLDLSKIEADRLELEELPFDLAELLDDMVELMRPRAQERSLELRSVCEDLPAWVVGDPTRLRQVVVNLIGNAVKFTEAGEVELSARVVERAEGRARIAFAVRDTGIGIPADKQRAIFEAFSQADGSTTRRFGGTGLGLAISRRLVEAMGGTLEVESTEKAGSTFSFEAWFGAADSPRAADAGPTQEAVTATSSTPTSSGGRVLIAEDNPINQQVMVKMLTRLGYQVQVAEDGYQTVDEVRAGAWELVLMDVQMPNLGGIDATRILREEGHTLPIVALTAAAMKGDRERCLEAGMNDYVTKPVQRDALQATIERHLAACRRAAGHGTGGASTGGLLHQEEAAREIGLALDEYLELVGAFLGGVPERLDKLSAALEAEDTERLRELAHSIKGSSLNLRLEAIASSARALEELGYAGTLEGAAAELARLRAAVEEAQEALRAISAAEPSSTSPAE